jgi:hypothetical protein
MESITRFITKKLKLKVKVNDKKSAVARPWERKFPGFRFASASLPKRRIAPKAWTGSKSGSGNSPAGPEV